MSKEIEEYNKKKVYEIGNVVKYKDRYYLAYDSNFGFIPSKNPHHWGDITEEKFIKDYEKNTKTD